MYRLTVSYRRKFENQQQRDNAAGRGASPALLGCDSVRIFTGQTGISDSHFQEVVERAERPEIWFPCEVLRDSRRAEIERMSDDN
jgi:hypothetical protein